MTSQRDALRRSASANARDNASGFERKGAAVSLSGSRYDPGDPIGSLLFNVLGMVAESKADLICARTREGMAIARAKGRLRGKRPKVSPAQEGHVVRLHRAGDHTTTEIAELFAVTRSTVYRAIDGVHAQGSLAGSRRSIAGAFAWASEVRSMGNHGQARGSFDREFGPKVAGRHFNPPRWQV